MYSGVYTISEIKEKLNPIFNSYAVSKAYIFGSYARGTATPKSDIDIAIEPDYGFRPQHVCGILEESSDALDKDVDVYSLAEFKPNSDVLREIINDRIMLYDKSST